MDWRNNQWVGLGAAGLLVVGIAFLFWYTFGSGDTALERARGDTFKCDACDVVFAISMKEMVDNDDLYLTYFGKFGEAVPCRECGEETAFKVFYCPKCEEYGKYTVEDASGFSEPRCLKGHQIPFENQ
ncbi:MAG: hypothetical protein ACYTAN_06760 [Planctomycetota bacterium]|jgi:hypothetical protein